MENKKSHILIVDDDNRIRNLLKDYLSENHYLVSRPKTILLSLQHPSGVFLEDNGGKLLSSDIQQVSGLLCPDFVFSSFHLRARHKTIKFK